MKPARKDLLQQLPLFQNGGAGSDLCLRQTEKVYSVRKDRGNPFSADNYEVLAMPDDTTARKFIETHHYSGTYPAAKYRFGLWHRTSQGPDQLEGVAVWSLGAPNSLEKAFPDLEPRKAALDFGRFVLIDEVPGNGESWFIGQAAKLDMQRAVEEAERLELRKPRPVLGLTAFADMCPRRNLDGDIVFHGHFGTIYQASNAVYSGRTKATTVYLFADGTALDPTAISKVFGKPPRSGFEAVLKNLDAMGVDLPREGETRGQWQARCVVDGTLRASRNPGRLRYLMPLGTPALRRSVRFGYEPQAYPKRGDVDPSMLTKSAHPKPHVLATKQPGPSLFD